MNTMNEHRNKETREPCASALVCAFRRALVRVVLSFLALLPVLAYAGETGHTLTVTLRDVRGDGIAGATITVRDSAGTTDLAHTTTDAQGVATLPSLTADVVRVAVRGTLADSTPLSQRGQDARGIWLLLDTPLVQLDLRSERNGDILPDPTTMISADAPIPATPPAVTVVPISAAIAPTDSVHGGVPTAIPFVALPADVPAIRPSRIGQGMIMIGTLILLILVGWFLRTRRANQ